MEKELTKIQLKQITDKIIKKLKKEGFVIQFYKSFNSNSFYIKLDYGLCHTIRISDHKGKKYLKYKYNLLSSIGRSYIEKDKYKRFYFKLNDVNKMIQQIIEYKKRMLIKYGTTYEFLMKEQKLMNKDNKGFWTKSTII